MYKVESIHIYLPIYLHVHIYIYMFTYFAFIYLHIHLYHTFLYTGIHRPHSGKPSGAATPSSSIIVLVTPCFSLLLSGIVLATHDFATSDHSFAKSIGAKPISSTKISLGTEVGTVLPSPAEFSRRALHTASELGADNTEVDRTRHISFETARGPSWFKSPKVSKSRGLGACIATCLAKA